MFSEGSQKQKATHDDSIHTRGPELKNAETESRSKWIMRGRWNARGCLVEAVLLQGAIEMVQN